LGATDEQANFPVIYASGRQGVATTDLAVEPKNLKPLFDRDPGERPGPLRGRDGPAAMQVMALQYSEFVGKIAVGRVFSGAIRKNMKVSVVRQADGSSFPDTVVQVLEFDRLGPREAEEIRGGDICAVGRDRRRRDWGHDLRAGPPPAAPAPDHRRADARHAVQGERLAVRQQGGQAADEPRAAGPAGQGASSTTSRCGSSRASGESEFIVSGRGLLHLGVLLETIRREGGELRRRQAAGDHQEVDGKNRSRSSTWWWRCRTTTTTP